MGVRRRLLILGTCRTSLGVLYAGCTEITERACRAAGLHISKPERILIIRVYLGY